MTSFKILTVVALLSSINVFAEEAKSNWAHESQAALITANGNTTSETYSAKQKTAYSLESSKMTLSGSYLDGKARQTDKTSGTVTEVKNRKWDAGLRYDYNFTEALGAFTAQLAESDTNAAFIQRDSTDIGGKYLALKADDKSLQTEAGLRSTKTYDGTSNDYTTFARFYAEYSQAFNKDVSMKFWVEYLPNLKDSDKYLTNAEASLSTVLSSVFSMKNAYLANYHNYPVSTTVYQDKRLDSLFTTSLVAKF